MRADIKLTCICGSTEWNVSTEQTALYECVGCGLQAGIPPEGPIFTGTLEGVERYLEKRDREAFMELRRETNWLSMRGQDPQKSGLIDSLQDVWIAYGEAWVLWSRVLFPVKLDEPEPLRAD